MPIPIRWQCCVPECKESFDDIEATRAHELTHFEPKYKVGDVVGTLKVIRIRVIRTLVGRTAKVIYVVESDFWRDGNLFESQYSESSLEEEERLAREGRSITD